MDKKYALDLDVELARRWRERDIDALLLVSWGGAVVIGASFWTSVALAVYGLPLVAGA